jgi:hypothetical protein
MTPSEFRTWRSTWAWPSTISSTSTTGTLPRTEKAGYRTWRGGDRVHFSSAKSPGTRVVFTLYVQVPAAHSRLILTLVQAALHAQPRKRFNSSWNQSEITNGCAWAPYLIVGRIGGLLGLRGFEPPPPLTR